MDGTALPLWEERVRLPPDEHWLGPEHKDSQGEHVGLQPQLPPPQAPTPMTVAKSSKMEVQEVKVSQTSIQTQVLTFKALPSLLFPCFHERWSSLSD